MKIKLISALLLSSAAVPAFAQDTINSGSASDATAVSGSQSGSSSDNFNTNGQTQGQTANNAGIGNSTSGSASNSNANASTSSGATSNGNQQGQSANNDQGQSQGQTATGGSSSNTNSLGQQASNMQGVNISTTYNTEQRYKTRQEFRTNAAVPLAASSSFSSDYCGGTVSGGASAAPIGISIGGAAPTFDKSCQSLRRAEKFGMAAANYSNMGQPEYAMKLMSLMVWSICTADSQGPKADKATAAACAQILSMGDAQPSADVYSVPTPPPAAPVTPMETQKPNMEPLPGTTTETYPPKTPRGDAGKPDPLAIAH